MRLLQLRDAISSSVQLFKQKGVDPIDILLTPVLQFSLAVLGFDDEGLFAGEGLENENISFSEVLRMSAQPTRQSSMMDEA